MMRRMEFGLVIALGAGAAGCGKVSSPSQPVAAASTPVKQSNEMEVKASPLLLKQLTLGEPTLESVGAAITVAAQLEADETRTTRVSSPMMGRITSLLVHEGQMVKKGQLLALLNSTGLSEAQLSYLKAISQKQLAQRAMDRAKRLIEADVIGSAEVHRREAELSQASAEMDAAADQLSLLGMPAEEIEELRKSRTLHSVSRIVASMDGTVLDRKITLGQVVQPADTVFDIADLSSLWMVADVPEQNAGRLRVGQAVEAEIPALGRTLRGHLSFVSSTVNPQTRTVRCRMDVPNTNQQLKPAMLATVILKEQSERQRLVPMSALVREGNEEYIFVQVKPNVFLLRPVKVGAEFGEKRVILEGVQPGEKLVLDGAFHLNNERRKQAIQGSEGG
ncbi:efflux RND transporter periplasmic adaptor subunit [Bryobacter aggregatus]|uniref:efflux RND transporter periplasmic adaptor subunit n=1 Tax=Bryobacter aggregatus TaxID=360054 RepID=UPI000691E924|nr:efflux RND transporter periplasmic adaptor subunit [Bryobacter aggregatus]